MTASAKVVALDVSEEKLSLARSVGAELAIDARAPDAAAQVTRETDGGAHGVLLTAVSPPAFAQALQLVNEVFADLKDGKVDGRIVLDLG